jgi:hypothetical protein
MRFNSSNILLVFSNRPAAGVNESPLKRDHARDKVTLVFNTGRNCSAYQRLKARD